MGCGADDTADIKDQLRDEIAEELHKELVDMWLPLKLMSVLIYLSNSTGGHGKTGNDSKIFFHSRKKNHRYL